MSGSEAILLTMGLPQSYFPRLGEHGWRIIIIFAGRILSGEERQSDNTAIICSTDTILHEIPASLSGGRHVRDMTGGGIPLLDMMPRLARRVPSL